MLTSGGRRELAGRSVQEYGPMRIPTLGSSTGSLSLSLSLFLDVPYAPSPGTCTHTYIGYLSQPTCYLSKDRGIANLVL